MPGELAPFSWFDMGATNTLKAAMIVSLYPDTDAATGIADAAKTIEIEAKGFGW